MDFTLKDKLPGLLIFIDFQKAFDSLEWNFLLSCLEAFNFGPDFIRWVKTFYKNIQSCVINNGLLSEYFTLEQGLRQGDPLFGGLFLFYCNYDVKDTPITSQFYSELLKWWSDFREEFDTERDRQNIVWNNKEIRIKNKPVFYKNFFESGITYVSDLLFHLNNTDSFNIISQKISRTNVLIWAGLSTFIFENNYRIYSCISRPHV